LRVASRFQALEPKTQLTTGEIEYLGKVKTEQIKRVAKELIARFPDKFSSNFEDNKHAVNALTKGPTTKVRNQIAGYITHKFSLAQADSSSENAEEEMQT
jgi:small subunit ribosomal protein S17e